MPSICTTATDGGFVDGDAIIAYYPLELLEEIFRAIHEARAEFLSAVSENRPRRTSSAYPKTFGRRLKTPLQEVAWKTVNGEP